MKIFDHHQHVGWYSDGYHSPSEIWRTKEDVGLSDIAVSSTSTCAELYKLVVREMLELKRLGGNQIHPFLWLTPRMMCTWGIRFMLHSKVKWEGIKMHWQIHREWYYNHKLSQRAVEIARILSVPILLHTGEFKECSSQIFIPLIKSNSDITFILAHGRPINEAKQVLRECPNCMVDTAFMPIEHICELVENGIGNRILFGTDAPIDRVFGIGRNSADYIKKCILEIRSSLPALVADKILERTILT